MGNGSAKSDTQCVSGRLDCADVNSKRRTSNITELRAIAMDCLLTLCVQFMPEGNPSVVASVVLTQFVKRSLLSLIKFPLLFLFPL